MNKTFLKRLARLRGEIDKADRQLILALARRMGVSRKMGALKKAFGVPIVQKTRWNALMKKRKTLAKSRKVDVRMVDGIFRLIQKESIAVQKKAKRR